VKTIYSFGLWMKRLETIWLLILLSTLISASDNGIKAQIPETNQSGAVLVQQQATLDRIEGSYAVLYLRPDEQLKIDFPLALMPPGCKEGDIINISIGIDENGTSIDREVARNLIDRIGNKG